MLFPRFAQTAAALLLSAIGFAAPVQAQNNKQIISGTWYEDRASNGGNQSDILLTFAQTPANQFLNVTNVACNFTAASGQVISTMNLFAGTTSGANDLGRTYSIKGSATSAVPNIIPLFSYKPGPGRYPTIQISSQSTGQFFNAADCVIVGNLTEQLSG
jgi:hypothetical protein